MSEDYLINLCANITSAINGEHQADNSQEILMESE